jgi:outer membrane lipoprotein-sorting protein
LVLVGVGFGVWLLVLVVGVGVRWGLNDSPLSVLLNPNQDLARYAHVVQDDAQVLMIEARDNRRREFGTITIAFAKIAGAPGGLSLQGWNTRDAQNNLTTVRLNNQRFNVPVADAAFRYREPTRRGPRG